MVVPIVHGSMGEMTLDRRVHIRVWRVLVVHCRGFVKLGERARCWRLERVHDLGWVGGIVERGWRGIVVRGWRGSRGMGVLLVGFGFG